MMSLFRKIIRTPLLLVALAIGLTLTGLCGCDEEDSALFVSSVQPNFTEQDVTTDEALSGAWWYQDEMSITFALGDHSTYEVVFEEKENDKHFTSHFEGHLFHLGADSFLDLYPAQIPAGSEFYYMHFFPCHTVAKIDFQRDELEITFLSATWLDKQIKAGTIEIAHASANDTLLLTAPTQDIQEVLFMNASNGEAFLVALRFARSPSEEEK
jgi:hypothetical protein